MAPDLVQQQAYNNLAAGSYTLVVQDANGCTFQLHRMLISNTGGATAVAITPTDATCGQSNGSITIGAVTGGVAPYTYDLTTQEVITATTVYSNLAAGSYTVVCKRCQRLYFHCTSCNHRIAPADQLLQSPTRLLSVLRPMLISQQQP